MEKASKKGVAIRFGGRKGGGILPKFPLPPFMTQEINPSPLQNFCRMAFGAFQYVVVVTQGDILATLEAFFLCRFSPEKRVFLCASSNDTLLAQLSSELPREETVFLFLARRPEEFWGLLSFFALRDWKRILVGEPHGAFAECARECFVPFLPVDIPCFSFWHRSAFLYLPLMFWGIDPEEMEQGFQEGYVDLREQALRVALFISQGLEERTKVYIVADTPLLEKVTVSFVPLLEGCFGKRGIFRATNGESLWREGEELLHSTVVSVRGNHSSELRVRIPQAFFSGSGLFSRRSFLRQCSFAGVREAAFHFLKSFLQQAKENLVDVELPGITPFSLGQYMAFLQCLACYGAWLEGVDIFSDPPLVQFEHSIVSFLARQSGEEG